QTVMVRKPVEWVQWPQRFKAQGFINDFSADGAPYFITTTLEDRKRTLSGHHLQGTPRYIPPPETFLGLLGGDYDETPAHSAGKTGFQGIWNGAEKFDIQFAGDTRSLGRGAGRAFWGGGMGMGGGGMMGMGGGDGKAGEKGLDFFEVDDSVRASRENEKLLKQ